MARATQNVEVTFDRQARESIRSLVGAIDRLSTAIVNGEDVELLVDAPENVEVLRRLVEDVKTRKPNPAVIERDGIVLRERAWANAVD
jgi:sRNA-binding carbon storage regulator CsrA